MTTQNASDTIPSSSGSAPNSAPGSPRNRIKFLCSHGGRILPRPSDGQLRYIGGETRVISVPPDITFHELMKKLTYLIDGEMILKYQVASEDLDALVTVRCDEDVGYMCDEIERHENAGNSSRLRGFLFPAPNPPAAERETPTASQAIEQRYIDAINGIARPKHHHSGLLGSHSACSSPTSPDNNEAAINEATAFFVHHHSGGRMMSMDRVRSSPSICSMTVMPQQTHHLVHQQPQPPPPVQQYVHHYPTGGPGYQSSPKPPIAGEGRLISVRSVGRAEGVRYQFDSPGASPTRHYYAVMQNRGGVGLGGGNGCCIKGLHYEDPNHFSDRPSSRAVSPRHSTIRHTRADI